MPSRRKYMVDPPHLFEFVLSEIFEFARETAEGGEENLRTVLYRYIGANYCRKNVDTAERYVGIRSSKSKIGKGDETGSVSQATIGGRQRAQSPSEKVGGQDRQTKSMGSNVMSTRLFRKPTVDVHGIEKPYGDKQRHDITALRGS